MKKSILWILASFLLLAVGCQKEEKTDSVSFETALPVMTEEIASISIVSSYTGTDAVQIPVAFGGDAVKGTDYQVSAEAFVLGGAAPVKTIQITPLVFGSNKKVTLNLQVPSGFVQGRIPMMEFTLADKLGYLSFEKAASSMTENLAVKVLMVDGNGAAKAVSKETVVELAVDKEKSTAVEGVNFEFEKGNQAVFKAGESVAMVPVRLKKYEPGKEQIVLTIPENPKFSDGQYISTKVRMLGGIELLIGGKWKVKSMSPDKQYLVDMMMADLSKLEGYPVYNAEDAFEIDVEAGKFIPAFKSEIKNYFIGESQFRTLDDSWYPLHRKSDTEITHDMNFGNGWMSVDRYMFDQVNRNFSATSKSEDKEGVVGFSITENEDKSVSLNVVIMDFVPKDTFTHPMFEWGGCGPEKGRQDGEKPVAHLGGVAIVLECVKAD